MPQPLQKSPIFAHQSKDAGYAALRTGFWFVNSASIPLTLPSICFTIANATKTARLRPTQPHLLVLLVQRTANLAILQPACSAALTTISTIVHVLVAVLSHL